MHNKFSNCFVWVSPSTSDLRFHDMKIWQEFPFKKYGITKGRGRANVTSNFKTSG